MRARGRNYRGGFTRGEIRRGEHNLQTCRVRGCSARQKGPYCPRHNDNGMSNARLVSKLMETHNAKELRRLASNSGVKRKRGDSKKQTAWRIVKQNREAAVEACR